MLVYCRKLVVMFLSIALKSETGNYLINGEWTIDWPRKFSVAGTVVDYERDANKPEVFTAIGPLLENVVVMVRLFSNSLPMIYGINLLCKFDPFKFKLENYK